VNGIYFGLSFSTTKSNAAESDFERTWKKN